MYVGAQLLSSPWLSVNCGTRLAQTYARISMNTERRAPSCKFFFFLRAILKTRKMRDDLLFRSTSFLQAAFVRQIDGDGHKTKLQGSSVPFIYVTTEDVKTVNDLVTQGIANALNQKHVCTLASTFDHGKNLPQAWRRHFFCTMRQ